MIDLRAYWPQPAAGTQLIVQSKTDAFSTPGHKTITRRYVNRGTVEGNPVMRMDEYNSTGWLSGWEFYDDGTQLLEVGTAQSASHKIYKAGKEIQWGGEMDLEQVSARSLEVDVAKSSGVTAGYWNYGYQRIELKEFIESFENDGGLTFCDVVKLNVLQSWCATSGCAWPTGQSVVTLDYWLAPGVGIVQLDYLTPNARRDYASAVVETWETP
jgi:hypothetical protein